MDIKLETKINGIVQDLIVIAQLQEFDKLSVSSSPLPLAPQRLHIQPNSWMQGLRRMLNGDTREHTKQHIENLYDDACCVADTLMNHVYLNTVLVLNKQQMTARESKDYLAHRQALDLITDWLSQSVPKLAMLHSTTYNGTETVFVLIERRTKQKLDEIKAYCAKLSEAYARMKILSPLSAGFTDELSPTTVATTLTLTPLPPGPVVSANSIASANTRPEIEKKKS